MFFKVMLLMSLVYVYVQIASTFENMFRQLSQSYDKQVMALRAITCSAMAYYCK